VCSRYGGPFSEKRFPARTTLYLQGEYADKVYYVQRGTVALFRTVAEDEGLGHARTLRHVGSILGDETLVEPYYQDSAQTESEVVLCIAEREAFLAWIGDRDTPGVRVLEVVLRARDVGPVHSISTAGSAVQRVALWLLRQIERNRSIDLPRHVIADLLGMRSETLSRALSALGREGAVIATRSTLQVVDRERLESICATVRDAQTG